MYPKAISLPSIRSHSWLHSTGLVILSSILIGLFGKVAIPLPFTPVPIVTQTAFILLLGCLLGSKRAFTAVLLFIAQGVGGLPVFAGGKCGMAVLMGTNGGYYLGYLTAAFLVGYIAERMENRSPKNMFLMLALGTLTIFLFGVPYLATFVGWSSAFLLGMLPFLLGDLLKIFACIKILQWIGWAKRN